MVKTKEEKRDERTSSDEKNSSDEKKLNESEGAAREDVRAKILKATSHIAKTEGLDAATPTRIYTATGIARSTIYRHWPKRVELLSAAIEEDEQQSSHQSEYIGSAASALRLAAETFEEESFVRMLASVMSRSDAGGEDAGPEWRELAKRLLRARLKALFEYIERAFEQRRVRGGLNQEQVLALCLGPMLYHRLILARPISKELVARQAKLLESLISQAVDESKPLES